MKDFFNQLWVKIMAWSFIIIGAVVLLLGGTSVGDIDGVVELVFGVIQAIGLLIIAIGKLLQKKATTNK
jgi:hypothetical protein